MTALADGWHPGRKPCAAIERAGFSHIELGRYKLGNSFVSPHIAGIAAKE